MVTHRKERAMDHDSREAARERRERASDSGEDTKEAEKERRRRLKEKNMDIEKVELRFHIWSLDSERASRFSRPIGPCRARFAAVEGVWGRVAGGTGASGPCLPVRYRASAGQWI